MKFIPSKPLKITLIIRFLIAVAVFIATSLIPIVKKCLSFRSEGIIPNQYIVVLNDDVDSNEDVLSCIPFMLDRKKRMTEVKIPPS